MISCCNIGSQEAVGAACNPCMVMCLSKTLEFTLQLPLSTIIIPSGCPTGHQLINWMVLIVNTSAMLIPKKYCNLPRPKTAGSLLQAFTLAQPIKYSFFSTYYKSNPHLLLINQTRFLQHLLQFRVAEYTYRASGKTIHKTCRINGDDLNFVVAAAISKHLVD